EWASVFSPPAQTVADLCHSLTNPPPATPLPKEVPHPLIGAIKNPVSNLPSTTTTVPISGWLHVSFTTTTPSFFLRALSFNVTQATNALTVRGEVMGRGTGLPGQLLSLAHENILDKTLQLGVTDPLDLTPQLHT